MQVIINYRKSVEENASEYYEKAKKARQKLDGAIKALDISRKKVADLEKKLVGQEVKPRFKKSRKSEWYDAFRWFFTSTGMLVIAGRDATTNEILIKKKTDKQDLVFHTSMAGSPFGVIKSEGKEIDKVSIQEAAQFVAAYSKAWRLGMTTLEVFCVKPEQVTKEAPSGEYLTKGAFMIYGKKDIINSPVKISIGIDKEGKVMAGPKDAVSKFTEKSISLTQGSDKSSEIAKKIRAKIGGELDDLIRVIPVGGCQIERS